MKIYPRLKSLLNNNYFRFYKTNLHNECPFWKDVDFQCAMKFCNVQMCEDKDIPLGLKGELPHQKYLKELQHVDCSEDLNMELGFLNKSLSDKIHQDLKRWSEYDDAQDNFCIMDDNQDGAEYVDLLLNPERKLSLEIRNYLTYITITRLRLHRLSRPIRPSHLGNNLSRKLFQIRRIEATFVIFVHHRHSISS